MSITKGALGRHVSARLAAGLLALAFALSPFAAAAHDVKAGSIAIERPWSRATPAGATTGAGYLTMNNEGTADDRLVSVSSSVVPELQIHEMKVENGVMSMKPVSGGIPIPAGKAVSLKPGSYHLMLMNLKQPLKAGETVLVTLTFEKAGNLDVELHVEKLGSNGPAGPASSRKSDDAMGGMSGHAGHDMESMGK